MPEDPQSKVSIDHDVVIEYTSWRGRKSTRRIRPISFSFGATKWHAEPQYLIKAFCYEKGRELEFAMSGISSWRPA